MSEPGNEGVGLFAGIVEDLLVGKFICVHTQSAAYHYLEDEISFGDVDVYLRRLNRRLRRTDDGEAFYAAYTEIDAPERRAQVKAQFKETVSHLEPLVRWLEIAMTAQHRDSPLEPGEQVFESVLLGAIESTPALKEQLHTLASGTFFNVKHDVAKHQLSRVLEKLCLLGYLHRNTPKGSQYTATGRWSYVYEVLGFIAENEHIDLAQPADTQQELLS